VPHSIPAAVLSVKDSILKFVRPPKGISLLLFTISAAYVNLGMRPSVLCLVEIDNSQTVMQFLQCCLAIIIYHLLSSESLSLIEEVSLGTKFLFFTFPFSNLQTRKIRFCIYPCGKKFVFIFPYIKKLCMFFWGIIVTSLFVRYMLLQPFCNPF
jgi:hypothetical protein